MSRIRGRYIALAAAAVVLGLALGGGVIWVASEFSPNVQSDRIDARIAASESAQEAAEAQAEKRFAAYQGAGVTACENAVSSQLKAPATARFAITGNTVGGPDDDHLDGKVIGTVDSQNGFGALVRSDWTCIVPPGSSLTAMNATITDLVQR